MSGVFINSKGSNKSLLEELRFKIGEQFDLNEFNVKSLESVFKNGIEYDVYEYIKADIKAIFGVKLVQNIILYYNADILCKVIYVFEKSNYEYLNLKITEYNIQDFILEVLIKGLEYCQIEAKKI